MSQQVQQVQQAQKVGRKYANLFKPKNDDPPPPNPAFGSDNTSGVSPEVLAEIAEHNVEYDTPYLTDSVSAIAFPMALAEIGFPSLEEGGAIAWAPTGTAANVLALTHLARIGAAVVCTHLSHITTDEAAAPEVNSGLKIKEIVAQDGKLHPNPADGDKYTAQKEAWDLIEADLGTATGKPTERRALVEIMVISQTTEMGTVYTPAEIKALRDYCDYGPSAWTANRILRKTPWKLHIDGARIANAAAFLGVPLSAICQHADSFAFGFAKNGGLDTEAVAFKQSSNYNLRALVKSQLCIVSKSRFSAAQVIAFLDRTVNDVPLWLRNGLYANQKALQLAQAMVNAGLLLDLTVKPGFDRQLVVPIEANGVFFQIPNALGDLIMEKFTFYYWFTRAVSSDFRLMTSFFTKDSDIQDFETQVKVIVDEYYNKGRRADPKFKRYQLF